MEVPRGPAFIGIEDTALTAADRERIAHPLVGGVVLFARNFADCAQLEALTASIRTLRRPAPLIAVDHEGGRVQRFRDGFTRLPPMRRLGVQWDRDPQGAVRSARAIGYLLAAELRALDVDFSFAPV
ncbi:MAG TPA: glycoside hydrolase family 3 N-terminal domain-containing protein, partial [Casimicrobiaceae bacterium]|nr:glycoside hydrolase family 3 N-terminal domain-containing protein [Casimicrobiaceae bacterium]